MMISIQAATDMNKASVPTESAAAVVPAVGAEPAAAVQPAEGVEPAEEPDPQSEDEPRQPGAKAIPRIWIPAIFSIGLLIAAVYLGGRIVSAHSQSSAHVVARQAAVNVAPPPALAPAVVAQARSIPATAPLPLAQSVPGARSKTESKPQPKPETETPVDAALPATIAVDEQIPTITPEAGERYIQVGALDLKLTRSYLPQLREARFEPHVAPGPTPDLLRVLIGPFPNRDSLNVAKAELDKAGIANFVRQY